MTPDTKRMTPYDTSTLPPVLDHDQIFTRYCGGIGSAKKPTQHIAHKERAPVCPAKISTHYTVYSIS